MERTKVESSNIESIGYDAEDRVLEVEFKHKGRVYQYFNVPEYIYKGIMRALSKGVYLNSKVKNRYRYAEIK